MSEMGVFELTTLEMLVIPEAGVTDATVIEGGSEAKIGIFARLNSSPGVLLTKSPISPVGFSSPTVSPFGAAVAAKV